MENIKGQLFELLESIQGNGSFETSGIEKITSPGLRIKGIGEIGIPITQMQIAEIIKISQKAPFGKGSKTITDTSIRSAWELDSDKLSFHNEDWKGFMEKVLKKTKEGLGIESNSVTASLYKLLVYEEGDFFLSHKDSEKEPGMFGTLIIGLPSTHSGGELLIRFDGKENTIDFSLPASNYKMPYVAFFADCDHEIKPITSGHRVSLVYNLIQNPGAEKISQSKISAKVGQMAAILKSMSSSITTKPKAVLLAHQYTPANFSLSSLKQHDRPRAELLLEAAGEAGYFAALGLVTHYQMGELEGDYNEYDYRSRYRSSHSENSSDGTMGEIYEEYTTIEHWHNGEMPSLGEISIENEDMLSNFKIGEGLPIEEEEEGFTGNAGMTMEYWYHYGAVILWPKHKHIELLSTASIPVRLDWLNYYYQNWANSELNSVEMSQHIITRFSENELTERDLFSTDFSIVASVLVNLKNEKFILDKYKALLISVFKKIQANNWVGLLQTFEPKMFTSIFEQVASRGDVYSLNHVLEILKSCSANPSAPLDVFVQHHIQNIPNYLASVQLSELKQTNRIIEEEHLTLKNTIIAVLEKVLTFSQFKDEDTDWINRTLDRITKSMTRSYVNSVLVVVIQNKKGNLAEKIKEICISDLTGRTTVKPTPPSDWKRALPNTKNNIEIWNILKPFLESADMQVFEYKKGEAYRRDMESAINSVTIDLKLETIRKGSPHILKITKTQAAYQKSLENFQKDIAIIETLGV
ncbi:MAG: 2OG-Fe(II) oxygenase [Bacteroidetes bacterium]|nr:2OG-Fe(II) oxygenase [Bacteroidota bacterium]